MSKNPFSEVFKLWGYEQYTGNFDWEKAVNSSRQNAEAWGKAAKAASEGAQAIARRQLEIIQRQTEETSKFFANFASSKSPETALEQLTKAVKANADSLLSNSKELFEVASKSATEAAEIINKRLSAAISECMEEAANSSSSSSSDSKPKRNAA